MPIYKKFLRTMSGWEAEFLGHFDLVEIDGDYRRVTNARTESMNGLIKALDNLGKGYSFATLKKKVLLRFGGMVSNSELNAFSFDVEQMDPEEDAWVWSLVVKGIDPKEVVEASRVCSL